MDIKALYNEKLGTLEDCLALLKDGDSIACSGVVNEAVTFLENLPKAVMNLKDIVIVKGRDHVYDWQFDPAMGEHMHMYGHLFGDSVRKSHKLGMADYLPSDLSTFSAIRTAVRPNNVFIANTTDMDEEGYLQLPYCQMFEKEQLACADTVIVEINPNFRPVNGGLKIHISQVTKMFVSERPFYTIPVAEPDETDRKIGDIIADMIHDGDTIQLGIGRLPDALAVKLREKNDLGLHTEMFTSNMVDLIRRGNINGKYKTVHPGEHVGAFALGDLALYETLHTNPACRIAPSSYANNPSIIAQQDNMRSVNTCLEIDLLGQISSESIGAVQFSGTGGAADFASGAIRAKNGRGIVAFTSTAKKGTMSKIKCLLTPGSAVTIHRNLADTIVTEYGIAELKGLSVPERARALISIAHPDFREQLTEEAKQIGFI